MYSERIMNNRIWMIAVSDPMTKESNQDDASWTKLLFDPRKKGSISMFQGYSDCW